MIGVIVDVIRRRIMKNRLNAKGPTKIETLRLVPDEVGKMQVEDSADFRLNLDETVADVTV